MSVFKDLYIEKQHKLLVVTDLQAVSLITVLDAVKVVRMDGLEQLDPLIIANASGNSLMWVDTESIDGVVCLCESSDFLRDPLLGSITRVLNPGGSLLLYMNPHYWRKSMDSSLERKIQQYGLLDIQSSSNSPPFWVMGRKPSLENVSISSIEEISQVLPEVQIDDDIKAIDEDIPLSNEDVKKRQRPPG